MPTEPRQVPVSPQPDAAGRRLHIHGIEEMPAGYDAEVAELFRDLRSATTLSEMDLAARIGTRPEVVQALEQGALYALPPWPETCRVVNAYGAILNLDVRPLLRRIYAQLEAGIVELQPKAMPDHPMMTPPDGGDFGFGAGNSSAASSPNPLDIPWPPAPPAAQPQRPRPNPNSGPPPAPPPQRANAGPQPHPQHPQNAWPHPHPQGAQHPQQSWPGAQPQGPRPSAPQRRPAAPQASPDRRPPQPAPQAQPPQPQPQPQPHPQPMPPRQMPQPQLEPELQDAEFELDVPPQAAPAPEKKRRRPALLKWIIGALVVAVIGAGLWFALSQAPVPGLQSPGAGKLDPDDPRSRKADRLPDAF
jgi:hypothetical protein